MRRAVASIAILLVAACASAPRAEPVTAPPAGPAAPLVSLEAPPAEDDLRAAVAALPRRGPEDPIQVAVFDPAVPPQLRRAVDPRALQRAVVVALGADARLRVSRVAEVVDPMGRKLVTLDDHVAAVRARELHPDVWVLPRAVLEEGGHAVVAEVASGWDAAARVEARATGEEAGASVAAQVQAAVERMAPAFPSRPAFARLDAERKEAEARRQAAARRELEARAGITADDDAATRLRKLYEAQQQQGGAGR